MEWFGPWERGEISNLVSSVYKYYTSTHTRTHDPCIKLVWCRSVVQRPHGNLTEYLSIMRPKENTLFRPLNPFNNPRKATGFLHSAHWFDVIRGLPLKELLSLVAVPSTQDVLSAVMDEMNTMFGQMWDIVDAMEVLPRRHIHTPKRYAIFVLVHSCI